MYTTGKVVAQDVAAAVAWFRKAAEQEFADAQIGLCVLYRLGKGVAQDAAVIVAWYVKAAEQGNSNAQGHIGMMHRCGEGVAQDFAAAKVNTRVAVAMIGAAVCALQLPALETRNFRSNGGSLPYSAFKSVNYCIRTYQRSDWLITKQGRWRVCIYDAGQCGCFL
jgi:hypothetical protein